jgi:gliding motility-associated-like protein
MRLFLLIIISLTIQSIYGQYILNGNAMQDATCNCYKLTNAQNSQVGSMWNINKLNLNNSFDFKFDVYLGTNDANGADGIAFILQPVSTSLGMVGGGLGYEGITPSVGILIDTWQNTAVADPDFDYISIQKNGNVNHALNQDLATPVPASATSPNIEDGQYHILRIKWDEPNKNLIVYFDGVERQNIIVNMVADIFGNDPLVFWGFTAATGGANNLQKVCTRLSPNFNFNSSSNNYCLGSAITFTESSDAFAPITNWVWNFGDGTTFTGQNPPPKTYSALGSYQVSLTVAGIDGCTSEPLVKTVNIVQAPSSNFTIQSLLCSNQSVQFTDASLQNNSGPANSWLWEFSDGTSSTLQNPIKTFSNQGAFNVKLTANNQYNCVTNFKDSNIIINPTPIVNFSQQNIGCQKDSLTFTAMVNFNAPNPNLYNWVFSNGVSYLGSNLASVKNYYANADIYTTKLVATNSFGCKDSVSQTNLVLPKPVVSLQALNTPCIGSTAPIQFISTLANSPGNTSFNYTGTIINPSNASVNYTSNGFNYNFTQAGNYAIYSNVLASNGCTSLDSFSLTIFNKPQLNFTIVNKDTLCAGGNLLLRNLSPQTLSNVNIFWSALNTSNNNNYASLTNGTTLTNTLGNFNWPSTVNNQIKIIASAATNSCTDSILLPYIINATPSLIPLDTLFKCSYNGSFALQSPTLNNPFLGTFSSMGNAVTNNTFNPANAIEGNNLINHLFTSQAGCIANSAQIINIQKPLTLNAGPNVFVLQGGQINFNASAFGLALSGTSFNWLPNTTLQNSTSLQALCKPTQTQVYTLHASTSNGCLSSDSLTVNLALDIEIPNTFTPNNDGINDTWQIKYLNTQPAASIKVFNRFGQLVYNANANSQPFNGLYKNSPLPVGTYFYIISTTLNKVYKGYVTIIR